MSAATSCISAWMCLFEAISSGPPSRYGRPVKSVAMPPASRTSSTPAAVSHGLRPNSQKPLGQGAPRGTGIDSGRGDVFGQGNRDRKARIAVREVGGAVERIHVPAVAEHRALRQGRGIRRRSSRLPTALFGHDGMFGKVVAQAGNDRLLRAPVGFGDQVHFALVGNLGRVVEPRKQDLPRLTRRLNRYLKKWIHWTLGPAASVTDPVVQPREVLPL